MQFVLFRHADKQRSYEDDPPLSSQGRLQAASLRERVQKLSLPTPSQIYSSPKLRAQQTFKPLSEALSLRLQLRTELSERQSSESQTQFKSRIESWVQYLQTQSGVIFAVTHYDWIEDVLSLLPTDADLSENFYHSWAPCQYLHLEYRGQNHSDLWHVLQTGRISS